MLRSSEIPQRSWSWRNEIYHFLSLYPTDNTDQFLVNIDLVVQMDDDDLNDSDDKDMSSIVQTSAFTTISINLILLYKFQQVRV